MDPIQAAKEYVESFGSAELAAQHFNKKPSAVKMWLKLNRFPQEVFADMMQPEAEVEESPLLEEPENNDAAYEEALLNGEGLQEEGQEQEPDPAPSVYDDVIGELLDRVSRLEGQMAQVAAMRANSRMPEDASLARPGRLRPPMTPFADGRPVRQGARRVPPTGGGYDAGVMTGRAPTREQAHWSSMGQRGAPSGPAMPRKRKPGSPGTYGWNLSKAELARRRAAATTAIAAAKKG